MQNQAIIGCGARGAEYAAHLSADTRLVAVCDTDEEAAKRLASSVGCLHFQTIKDLLQNSDFQLLVVCTPTGLHAEHVIKALQAGKDVLCESPLCLTTAAAWQITETEKFCGRKLSLRGFALSELSKSLLPRMNDVNKEPVRFHLECLTATEIDPASWRNQIFPAGGQLYNHHSGAIFLLASMFGELLKLNTDVDRLQTEGQTERGGICMLRYSSGAMGTIVWSAGFEEPRSNLHLYFDGRSHVYPVEDLLVSAPSVAASTSLLVNEASVTLSNARQVVEVIEKVYKAI